METSARTGGAMYGFLACTAGQFMTRTVVTVKRHTTMRELGQLFEKHDFNAFSVVEDEKVLGIVSKFDFLRAFAFTSSQIAPPILLGAALGFVFLACGWFIGTVLSAP